MLSSLVVHRNVACKASPTRRLEFSATNLYDSNVSQMGDTSFEGGGGGCVEKFNVLEREFEM